MYVCKILFSFQNNPVIFHEYAMTILAVLTCLAFFCKKIKKLYWRLWGFYLFLPVIHICCDVYQETKTIVDKLDFWMKVPVENADIPHVLHLICGKRKFLIKEAEGGESQTHFSIKNRARTHVHAAWCISLFGDKLGGKGREALCPRQNTGILQYVK